MKKALLSLLSLSAIVLVACGPSKAYVASEAAANDAMAKLETVSDMAQVPTIMNEYTTQIETIATENGALAGDEATKFSEVANKVAALAQVKADSLNKVAMEMAAAAVAEAAALAAAEEEAAKTSKKK